MTVLRRKLLRELYASKGLLLAITSIIAVGVMCYVSMQSAYHNLSEAKRSYYLRCRMADFWIDLKKAPIAELDSLADLQGVSEIRPRIQFPVTVDLSGVERPINGLVVSLPAQRRPVINDIVLRRGGYFTDRRRNEVIVTDSFAREHSLRPGSWIHVLMNNRRQELYVVGTAISSEFTYLIGGGSLIPDPANFGVFYVKQRFAEEVFDFQGATNQIVGRFSPDSQGRGEELFRRAETLLEPFGVSAATPLSRQASNQFLTSEIQGLGAFATVVPTIFLAVAALVLNVLITRLARRQRIVVGTFKAIGYTDSQMFWHFLQYGLIVGAMGGLLGGLLGYLASAGMTVVYRLYFEFPELRCGFYWYTHGVGMTVSLLCAAAGALRGASAMLQLQPAEAMRPEPPRRGGAIWLERWGGLWRRLGASWRTVLRSIVRNRFRTAAGVFAAAMGAALLVTGFAFVESTDFLVDFQFYRVARSDIDLSFSQERGEDALLEVRRLPGVDHAEPVLNVACTFVRGPYRRKAGVIGLLPEARLMTPRDTSGRPIRLPTAGLVVTRRLAEILHAAPGDAVTLIPVKGERRAVDVEVANIADSFVGLEAYADIRYLSRVVGEEFAMSGAQLLTDGNPGRLTQLHRDLKKAPVVESVVSRTRMIESLNEVLLANLIFSIGFLIAFAGVIFFGSVVNASMVNLAERQREVATYLALGYSEWQVGGLFLRESLLTNILGAAAGLPIGYFLTWLTVVFYNSDLLRLPLVTAPWIWTTTFALALLFTLAAHGVVQLSIFRMDFLTALKVKE